MNAFIKNFFKEVKLLTGAIVHQGEELVMQMKVIRRYLMTSDKFSGLTTNELTYAFYLNSHGELDQVYRHYNKELNAEFIGDVLLAYLQVKKRLYSRAGVQALLEGPKAEAPRLNVQQIREFIQVDYNHFLNDRLDYIVGVFLKYQYLRQEGLISIYHKDYWLTLCRYAMDVREWTARRDRNKELLEQYKIIKANNWIPAPEMRAIIYEARRLLYLEFFNDLQQLNIKNFLTEVQCQKV